MIRSIIIEDEIEAGHALTALLNTYCKDVEVIGVYPGIAAALEAIHKHRVNLIFLDVELEGESGFDLFQKTDASTFEVIFTTGKSQYALQAIKHACLEYLLKPIEKDELIRAVKKFSEKQTLVGYRQQVEILLHNLKSPRSQKLCIPIATGFVYLNTSEIVMCEAAANYTLIYTTTEKVVCSKNIGALEDMMDGEIMFRCHKSYLINLGHVKKIEKKEEHRAYMTGGMSAEISQRKKDELLEVLKRVQGA
ncbi:MAG TPA: LytTR family DNA-binding domain-containing protein [Cyclobacteriaceae bacterium]|nr:LytTR family DNA-binding domain-containing protein [Cyclobacteriaceae bacterium]